MRNLVKNVLMLMVLCLIAGVAEARQLSVDEALARLRNESSKGMRKVQGMANTLSLACTKSESGTNTVYVMNRSNGGMVFLSADDCAPAVLGWTDGGCYDEDSIPSSMQWWLKQYSQSIAQASAASTPIRRIYLDNPTVDALMSTEWDQQYPYYKYCTELGEKVYTGCVATAMAQIMKYYRWPVTGSGSHSYELTKEDGTKVTVSSNFAEHTYDWDNMLDSYPYSEGFGTTEVQENSVALLMKDCGVALNMGYSTSGSGAATNMVPYAMSTYFGYDKGARCVHRNYCTDEEWEQLLVDELNAGRPILYGGSSNNEGGHAFVCDGYDKSGYFHFNWGWSGSYNGFFLVTGTGALKPYAWSTDEGYGYTNSQIIGIGLKPDEGGTPPPGGLGMPLGYTLSATEVARTSYVYLSSSYMFNVGSAPLVAKLGLMFTNGEDVFYCANPNAAGTYTLDGYYMPSYFVYVSGVLKNGTYDVYPVFKDMDNPELGWQLMKLADGWVAPQVTVTGTEPDMYLTGMAKAYSHGQNTKNNRVVGDDIQFRVPVKFLKDVEDVYASLSIYKVNDDNTQTYKCAAYCYDITASAGDAMELSFTAPSYITFDEGNYYILVKYGYYNMKPDDFNTVYFKVVDHMPTISDVPTTVKGLKEGTKTKEDLKEIVEDVLTTVTVGI